MVMGVVNRQIRVATGFHDVFHRFQVGQVAGTASLEVKLIRQLEAMWE